MSQYVYCDDHGKLLSQNLQKIIKCIRTANGFFIYDNIVERSYHNRELGFDIYRHDKKIGNCMEDAVINFITANAINNFLVNLKQNDFMDIIVQTKPHTMCCDHLKKDCFDDSFYDCNCCGYHFPRIITKNTLDLTFDAVKMVTPYVINHFARINHLEQRRRKEIKKRRKSNK
jgi:hypothetical protein